MTRSSADAWPAPTPARRERKRRFSFALAFGRGLLGLALVGGAAALGVVTAYRADLPPAETALAAPAAPQGLRLEDARGREYAWIGAPAARILALEEISPELRRALGAAEPRLWAGSTESAVSRALAQGFGPQRKPDDDDAPTPRFVRSLAAQWRYTQEDRLLLTLNRTAFGEGVHGFEAAAQHWFGRGAEKLDLAQAAALVGALEAPAGVDPFADSAAARLRTARALDLLAEADPAAEPEIAAARARPAHPSAAAAAGPDPVFVAWTLGQAPAELQAAGADADLRTTLDLRLQHAMDQAFESVLESAQGLDPRAEAAAVLLSRDGAVRAMAGGRRVGASGASNRAAALKRPIGVLFAPFAATASTAKGGGGAATVEALLRPGARAAEINKAALPIPYAELRKITRALGFDVEPPPGAKTAIGVRATALQTAGAFAALVNDGFATTPFGLVEALGPAETPRGPRRTIYKRQAEPLAARIRAAPEQAARLALQALGQRARLDAHARAAAPEGREILAMAAETGADVWFMGATADFICALWIGRDDGSPPAGADAALAARLWREILTESYAALPIPPRPVLNGPAPQSRFAAAAPDWRPSADWPSYGAEK